MQQIRNRVRIIGLLLCLTIILVACYFLLLWQNVPGGEIYRSPEQMLSEVKVGDKISIKAGSATGIVVGIKGRYDVDVEWQCEAKSANLIECLWQSKKPPTTVVIAFPKSKGISPGSNNYFYVLVLDKQENLLLTLVESSYNLIS